MSDQGESGLSCQFLKFQTAIVRISDISHFFVDAELIEEELGERLAPDDQYFLFTVMAMKYDGKSVGITVPYRDEGDASAYMDDVFRILQDHNLAKV